MDEIKINTIDELNNLEIKKKEIEIENEYLGCCSKTDKRLINFIVQLLLALLIIIFSIYQIKTLKYTFLCCHQHSVYL